MHTASGGRVEQFRATGRNAPHPHYPYALRIEAFGGNRLYGGQPHDVAEGIRAKRARMITGTCTSTYCCAAWRVTASLTAIKHIGRAALRRVHAAGPARLIRGPLFDGDPCPPVASPRWCGEKRHRRARRWHRPGPCWSTPSASATSPRRPGRPASRPTSASACSTGSSGGRVGVLPLAYRMVRRETASS